MHRLDRRSLLGTAGALAAGAVAAGTSFAAASDEPRAGIKKAFMLSGRARKGGGGLLEQFQLLKEAGFEGVELTSPSAIERGEILRARDESGLVIHGVSGSRHWQDPLSDPDPAVVERGMAAIRQEFDDCKAFGGTTVLLVPAVVKPPVSYRDAYTRSQANVRKLVPEAEKQGVKIAIEEVWNKFLLSSVEMARYVDEFQSPAVGAYFDVGNVVEFGYPEEWIRELGPRILKVHIKEYGQKNRFNYALGEGDIKWPAVREAFAAVGYKGWYTAEVPMGDLSHMRDVAKRMDQLLG
jgi:L-ribulose-5-phosphate 3-epimerase